MSRLPVTKNARNAELQTVDAMMALVWTFPSLAAYVGVVGPEQYGAARWFDPMHFYSWSLGGHATSGSINASRFILDVWNGSPKGRAVWPKLGRFSVRVAFGTWDQDHVDAFLAWCNDESRVMP